MEESRIGKPIPIGDIPSLAEDAKAPRVVTHDRPALTDDAHAETVPAESLAAVAQDARTSLYSPAPAIGNGWFDLMQMSWQLAMMPAVTWSSLVTASWKSWENSLQIQRSTR